MQDIEVRLQRVDQIERTGEDAAPTVYVNSATFNLGPYDVRMSLGQVESATEERLLVRTLATVIMSPQHAKAFSELLAKNVALYEQTFGQIQTTPISLPSSDIGEPPSSRSRSAARAKASQP